MNQQDRQETDNQQSGITDLSISEGQAEEVKGGNEKFHEYIEDYG